MKKKTQLIFVFVLAIWTNHVLESGHVTELTENFPGLLNALVFSERGRGYRHNMDSDNSFSLNDSLNNS